MKLTAANKYSGLLFVRAAVGIVVTGFLCGAVAAFSFTVAYILGALSIIAYLFIIFFYISRFTKSIQLHIDDELFRLRKGVIFVRVCSLPLSCVRFFDIRHSLLSGLFGVCSVVFYTASGRVRACGLDIDEALSLTAVVEAAIYEEIKD